MSPLMWRDSRIVRQMSLVHDWNQHREMAVISRPSVSSSNDRVLLLRCS